MDWRISRALADRLLAEAEDSREAEICGLLFGDAGEVVEAQACGNVAQTPATHFEIDPAALITAHKAERSGGPRVVGCYHSHPNGVAFPSSADREAALPGLWIIVAAGALHGWEGDGQGGFARVELHQR